MRWIVLLGLCLGLVLGALPAAEPVAPTEAAAESAYNEKVLRNSGIDPAGPGLVSFFRSHVLHPDHTATAKKPQSRTWGMTRLKLGRKPRAA